MIPRLVDELALQHHAELLTKASRPRPDNPLAARGPSWRSAVGWSIVAFGLRIAESR